MSPGPGRQADACQPPRATNPQARTERGGPGDVDSLRYAASGDATKIVALIQSAYRGESSRAGWTTEADLLDGPRIDEAAVAAALANPATRILLTAGADRQLTGCAQILREKDGTAAFGPFAVDPRQQGNGLGRRLLDAAEQAARDEWGADTMTMKVISARSELIAFYQRRGYQRTGESIPFPADARHRPRRGDLHFDVLAKKLGTDRPNDVPHRVS